MSVDAATGDGVSDSRRQPLGDICAGCRELAERVERLEQRLESAGEVLVPPKVTTTSCYWICVSVHAVVTFCLLSNGTTFQFGMCAAYAFVGTLMTCHALETRPVHSKVGRNLLATTIVSLAAFLGMWVGEFGDPKALLQVIWIVLPLMIAGGWLSAKLVVWVRGWRIVPPGHDSRFPRLQISHLLLGTLFAAIYLAVVRLVFAEPVRYSFSGIMGYAAYVTLPTSLSTFFACLIARIMFRPPVSLAFKLALPAAILVAMIAAYTVFLIVMGELNFDTDALAVLTLFSVSTTVGIYASSYFTFLMMRLAQYRFVLSHGDGRLDSRTAG